MTHQYITVSEIGWSCRNARWINGIQRAVARSFTICIVIATQHEDWTCRSARSGKQAQETEKFLLL